MSVTVNTLYVQTCAVLLEDPGLTLGLVTQQQFLDILGVVLLDFCQRAALLRNIFTQTITSGTQQYTVPDDVMKPELGFVSGIIIEKVGEADLTQNHFEWRTKTGPPEQWHEDNLAPKLVELYPNPTASGTTYAPPGKYGDFFPTDNNLTLIGPAAPDITSWSLGNTLQAIPDSFTHYLIYGILEQIFSAEGEMRDLQRAAYCRTRYIEGVRIADCIAESELMENGVL